MLNSHWTHGQATRHINANWTFSREWECPHWEQATSKELPTNLRARPVWIGPHAAEYLEGRLSTSTMTQCCSISSRAAKNATSTQMLFCLRPNSHRTRDATRSKWDLLSSMGVFTLHASKIKGKTFLCELGPHKEVSFVPWCCRHFESLKLRKKGTISGLWSFEFHRNKGEVETAHYREKLYISDLRELDNPKVQLRMELKDNAVPFQKKKECRLQNKILGFRGKDLTNNVVKKDPKTSVFKSRNVWFSSFLFQFLIKAFIAQKKVTEPFCLNHPNSWYAKYFFLSSPKIHLVQGSSFPN